MWSLSAEMISSGPRSGPLVSTFASVHGFQVRRGSLEDRLAGSGHRVGLVQLLRFVLADGVGERIAELLVGERDGAVPVGRIREHRGRRAKSRDRKRQHAAEGRGADSDRGGGEAAPGEDFGQQAPERMADDRRFCGEPGDDRLLVVGDVADALAGEHARVLLRFRHAFGIVRPARRHRRVAGLLEQLRPAIPARGEKPQAVHEHDGRTARRVGPLDLRLLLVADPHELPSRSGAKAARSSSLKSSGSSQAAKWPPCSTSWK